MVSDQQASIHSEYNSPTIIIFNDGQNVAVQELESGEISGVSVGTIHLQVDYESLTELWNGIS